MKRTCFAAVGLMLLAASAASARSPQVRGIVFQDDNQTGTLDAGERGIAKVAVSDGKEIWLTNDDGSFTMADPATRFVFLVKPSGYVPTGKWCVDLHKERPGTVQFGLKPREEKDFVFIHLSDIHGNFEQCQRELRALEKATPPRTFRPSTRCGLPSRAAWEPVLSPPKAHLSWPQP
jgi:hypothetical protein